MNNKKNMKKTMSVILCTAALATLFSFTALATQNTYAENGAIGTLLGAALICVLCKNPDLLTTIGNALKGIIGL